MTVYSSLRKPSSGLQDLFRVLLSHRTLIKEMIWREIVGRYKGSFLGLAWSFFNPLLMLVIYTFVFSTVFRSKWPGIGEEATTADFAVIFFAGLIVHGFVSECVNRAPGLITAHASYVKKVVFPLEILAVVICGSALFHTCVSVLVLMLGELVLSANLPWTVVLFPVAMLPLILGVVGITWFLASLGVYVKDIGQVTGMLMTILLFLSPIFFPVGAMPAAIQPLMKFNPLVFFLDAARSTLILGQGPDWGAWVLNLVIGMVIMWLGYFWFQRTRAGFSDVL